MSLPTILQKLLFSAAVTLAVAVPASAQALQVDSEEFKRLQGEVADLREANESYRKKLDAVTRQLAKLQEEMRASSERSTLAMQNVVTREDLKAALERLTAALEEKRENDQKLILEQFEKLESALASKRGAAGPKHGGPRQPASEAQNVIEGTFLPYEVEPDQTLGGIVLRYNAKLKKEGRATITLSEVRKANPTVNVDLVYPGQTILLPVPDKTEE